MGRVTASQFHTNLLKCLVTNICVYLNLTDRFALLSLDTYKDYDPYFYGDNLWVQLGDDTSTARWV